MTGLRLDTEVIEERLAHLQDGLEVLSKYQGTTRQDLEDDTELRWLVQHGILTSVQVVLDLSNHLVAAMDVESPRDYRGAILALARLGILPTEFAERISGMAGLRNVIVHEYAAVDQSVVSNVLNQRLGDFAEFGRHVREFVKRHEQKQRDE